MTINPRIKQDLIDRHHEPHGFDLLNMYKGIPLVYKATLLSIDEDRVKFEVEPPSSVCLSWEPETTILDDRNTEAIKGRIVDFDVIAGIVQLTDLAYIDRGLSHRTSVRVEPEESIPVEIRRGEQSVSGKIVDISLTGFGIHVVDLGDPPLQLNDKVRMTVKIIEQMVSPLGTIINIKSSNEFIRLAVRFLEDITIPIVIARYVIHRRAELHREIRNAYYTAYTRNNPNKGL